MISSRTRQDNKNNDPINTEYEVPIDIEEEEEDKKIKEIPRIEETPKEEITINITIILGTLIYILFLLFCLAFNAHHYSGFFFGRLT